jgi:glutathione-specific gamma-glutamylcyclotransferase
MSQEMHTRSTPQFGGPFPHLTAAERQRLLLQTEDALSSESDLWVFAYGSLLWRPCFVVAQRLAARAPAHAARLCIWTVEARGTPAVPGLGLGLERDPNGTCDGAILRVADGDRRAALSALWEREMLTGIYSPTLLNVHTNAEQVVRALAFVVQPKHPQYAGRHSLAAQARWIGAANGKLGSCTAYLRQTVQALHESGLSAPELESVLACIDASDSAITRS